MGNWVWRWSSPIGGSSQRGDRQARSRQSSVTKHRGARRRRRSRSAARHRHAASPELVRTGRYDLLHQIRKVGQSAPHLCCRSCSRIGAGSCWGSRRCLANRRRAIAVELGRVADREHRPECECHRSAYTAVIIGRERCHQSASSALEILGPTRWRCAFQSSL